MKGQVLIAVNARAPSGFDFVKACGRPTTRPADDRL